MQHTAEPYEERKKKQYLLLNSNEIRYFFSSYSQRLRIPAIQLPPAQLEHYLYNKSGAADHVVKYAKQHITATLVYYVN